MAAAASQENASAAAGSDVLTVKVAALDGETYYQVLGVMPRALAWQIKKGFQDLVRTYNLGEVETKLSREVASQSAKLLHRACMAYQVLCDDARRQAYDKFLRESGQKFYTKVTSLVLSEVEATKGEVYFLRRNFFRAQQAFGLAVQLAPSEARHKSRLGISLYHAAKESSREVPPEAIAALTEAAQADSKLDEPCLYLGFIYKEQGKLDRAEAQFKTAIDRNANNPRAKSELRLLLSRREKAEGGAIGMLDKLMRPKGKEGSRSTTTLRAARDAGIGNKEDEEETNPE